MKNKRARPKKTGTFDADPKTWITMAFAILPMLALFFKPTFIQFIYLYIIDALAFTILVRIDLKLFRKFFPESRYFFPDIDNEKISSAEFSERVALYKSIMSFPARRSIYLGICSSIKAVPSIAFGFYTWGFSVLLLAKCILVAAFTFSFYMGMSYLDAHNKMTKVLRDIHAKSNWSDVFRTTRIPRSERPLARFENLCLMSISLFCLGLVILIHGDESIPKWLSTFEMAYVLVLGMLMGYQLVHAGRSFMRNGVDSLTSYYRNVERGYNPAGIPLSTYPALAQFEHAINDAVEKCVESEREINQLMLQKAEDYRFLSLGRLTGLLMHDLINPISAIKYRLWNLSRDVPEYLVDDIKKLEFGINKITEMVVNVRDSIRDQTSRIRTSSFRRAHENAIELVKFTLKSSDERSFVSRIAVDMHGDWDVTTNIPHVEMTQILMNLYLNSMTNMLQHDVQDARIIIARCAESIDDAAISIVDNGTGLSADEFHQLTVNPERIPGAGIGLKLTRRLIERYSGALNISDDWNMRGTQFILTLKKGKTSESEDEIVAWHPSDTARENSPVASLQ